MLSSSGEGKGPFPLDVTSYFNPVDCKSLGILRTTLSRMAPGECLGVVCNRFQYREISAWTKKFRHEILSAVDQDGRVVLCVKKGGGMG